jgi:hypothetical protein
LFRRITARLTSTFLARFSDGTLTASASLALARKAAAHRAIAGPPQITVEPDMAALVAALAGVQALTGSPAASYLARRGIPLELAGQATIAYQPNFYGRPAVLFPLFDQDGALTACSGRHLDDGDPKARTAGPKGRTLFAIPGAREAATPVVTEAPIDALSLAACGVPTVALCGMSWPDWLPGTCVFRRVALAFDADDAGDTAAEKLRPLLESFGAKVERWRPAGGKDWNELLQAGTLQQQVADLCGKTPVHTPQDCPHDPMPATMPSQHDAGATGHPDDERHAAPYRCWYAGCTAVAVGPWHPIGPDVWQAECGAGHRIQRTEYSFQHPPEVSRGTPVALPAGLPAGMLPLWLYDRVHQIEPPSPAPADLTDEQIASAVAAARDEWERLVRPASYRRRKAAEVRDPELVAAVLTAGERLGWPALQLRPGERLAAGESNWRAFLANGPVDRLRDAQRALTRYADERIDDEHSN